MTTEVDTSTFTTSDAWEEHYNDLAERMQDLVSDVGAEDWSPDQQKEFDAIERQAKNAKRQADALLRKELCLDMPEDRLQRHDPAPGQPPLIDDYTRSVHRVVDDSQLLHRSDNVKEWLHRSGQLQGARRSPAAEKIGLGRYLQSIVTGPRDDIEARALSEGTDSAGGYTVPIALASQWIELLRTKSRAMQAGVRTMPLTTQVTNIASLVGDVTAAWRNENAQVTASDITVGQVQLTARSLACHLISSRELLQDSENALEMIIDSITGEMAVKLDKAILYGSGTAPEPEGVINVTGVNDINHGAGITNWDVLRDAAEDIEDANGMLPPDAAFIMSPANKTAFVTLKDTTNQPMQRPPGMEGYRLLETVAAPTTGTGEIVTGVWSDCILGMRLDLTIQRLEERYADYLQTGWVAHMRADVALQHPALFTTISNIT